MNSMFILAQSASEINEGISTTVMLLCIFFCLVGMILFGYGAFTLSNGSGSQSWIFMVSGVLLFLGPPLAVFLVNKFSLKAANSMPKLGGLSPAYQYERVVDIVPAKLNRV
jgi:hypothetical protein